MLFRNRFVKQGVLIELVCLPLLIIWILSITNTISIDGIMADLGCGQHDPGAIHSVNVEAINMYLITAWVLLSGGMILYAAFKESLNNVKSKPPYIRTKGIAFNENFKLSQEQRDLLRS